jgi:hypothetical protein
MNLSSSSTSFDRFFGSSAFLVRVDGNLPKKTEGSGAAGYVQ